MRCCTPIGFYIAIHAIEGDGLVGSGRFAVEAAIGVDGNAREGYPTRALVPSKTAQGPVAIVGDADLGRRKIDPAVVRAPSVTGKRSVRDRDGGIGGSEVDPATRIAPSVFVRRKNSACGGMGGGRQYQKRDDE